MNITDISVITDNGQPPVLGLIHHQDLEIGLNPEYSEYSHKFSDDGKILVVLSYPKEQPFFVNRCSIYRLTGGNFAITQRIDTFSDVIVSAICISPNSKYIAIAHSDGGNISIYKDVSGSFVFVDEITGGVGDITSIEFSFDSKYLFVPRNDGLYIYINQNDNFNYHNILLSDEHIVGDLKASRDGAFLASVESNNYIHLYMLDIGIYVDPELILLTGKIDIRSDSKYIYCLSRGRVFSLTYEMQDGNAILQTQTISFTPQLPYDVDGNLKVTDFCLSADDKFLIFASETDILVYEKNTETNYILANTVTVTTLDFPLNSIEKTLDGKYIAVSFKNMEVSPIVSVYKNINPNVLIKQAEEAYLIKYNEITHAKELEEITQINIKTDTGLK